MTLAWNGEDLGRILASVADEDGPDYQFFDLPVANYGSSNFDSVVGADGTVVGYSMWTGFSTNEGKGLSLATVSPEIELGTKLKVIWGEPGGGTRKATVEPHELGEVRVVVSPVPYSEVARVAYASGWRASGRA